MRANLVWHVVFNELFYSRTMTEATIKYIVHIKTLVMLVLLH